MLLRESARALMFDPLSDSSTHDVQSGPPAPAIRHTAPRPPPPPPRPPAGAPLQAGADLGQPALLGGQLGGRLFELGLPRGPPGLGRPPFPAPGGGLAGHLVD